MPEWLYIVLTGREEWQMLFSRQRNPWNQDGRLKHLRNLFRNDDYPGSNH